jgi:hypothetical protein
MSVEKVDMRTRKAMVSYLTGHFRYDTMNGCNASTSYAAKVKVYTFVPRDLMDNAYEIIGVDGALDSITDIMNEWDEEQGYSFQTGFNGWSGGYIVMYVGGRKPSEFKRVCLDCHQKNYDGNAIKCGRCGSSNMLDYNSFETYSFPGKSIDQGETFEDTDEWPMGTLRERVKLVLSFDAMIERCKEEFIDICRNFKVEERKVMVERTVNVLVEA